MTDAAYAEIEDEELPSDELDTGLGDERQTSVEERARAMGWHPLPIDPDNPQPGDYRGDPRRHTDAATFIAHGEEQLPILRDQTRRLSDKVARYTADIEGLRYTVAEQARAVKDAMDLARRSDERGYNRALQEMRAEQREAVAAGDTQAFDQVQERIDAAQRERDANAVPPARSEQAPASESVWPETTAFINDNPWFNSDPALHRAMIAEHNAVLQVHPNMSRAQQYARAKARVVEAFPDSFPEPNMPPAAEPEQMRVRRTAGVLAPSAPAPPPRRTSPFDQIDDPGERAQAKQAFTRLQNMDPGMTADEYMTLYTNPKADALSLRKARKV